MALNRPLLDKAVLAQISDVSFHASLVAAISEPR